MIFKINWKTATSRKDTTKDFKRTIRKRAFDKRQNFLIESRLRKCYVTARKKQIESTNNTTLFQTDIMINESRHNAMIDFESENNYVSTALTRRKKFFIRSKNKNAFEAFAIREGFVDKMNQKTISLSVAIQQHHEELIFDLIKMIIHEVVLKDSWLKKHNSSINWETRILTFEKCDCVIDIMSEHRQKTMTDERNKTKKLAHIRKEDLKTNFSSSDINRDQLNQQNKVIKKVTYLLSTPNRMILKNYHRSTRNEHSCSEKRSRQRSYLNINREIMKLDLNQRKNSRLNLYILCPRRNWKNFGSIWK